MFDRFRNYRYYRLQKLHDTRDSERTYEVYKHIKALDLVLGEYKFCGSEPILTFDFLSRFVEVANTLCMTESQAYVALP